MKQPYRVSVKFYFAGKNGCFSHHCLVVANTPLEAMRRFYAAMSTSNAPLTLNEGDYIVDISVEPIVDLDSHLITRDDGTFVSEKF